MTTRKSKPTVSPPIEWPTEQLQLIPVSVERKAPARGAQARPVETGLPAARPWLRRAKTTLH